MYSGRIHATGTRYCPSIEDKIVKFSDKPRHQIFIEPEGLSTDERYVQGMSTSLPADVQLAMLRTLPGLERCEVARFGYAIEYDCIDPTALDCSLMAKAVPGLFTAGQLNGSSGYEEAAGAGLPRGRERRAVRQGRAAVPARAGRGVSRRARGRPRHQGHAGAVPHDDVAVRIPAAAPAGQRPTCA